MRIVPRSAISTSLYFEITNDFQFHIIPVLNPDGYEYSRSEEANRMWRKNRRRNRKHRHGGSNSNSSSSSSLLLSSSVSDRTVDAGLCDGIDLNRNFPTGFGLTKTSKDPCREDYAGPKPLSEPESQALDKYMKKVGVRNVVAALSAHSYGQIVIFPWTYTKTKHPNDANFRKLSKRLEAAVGKGALDFQFGPALEIGSYLNGGSTKDFYSQLGVPYSATIELPPDKDTPASILSFKLPPRFVRDAEIYLYNIVKETAYFAKDHDGQRWLATTTEESYKMYSVTRAKLDLT